MAMAKLRLWMSTNSVAVPRPVYTMYYIETQHNWKDLPLSSLRTSKNQLLYYYFSSIRKPDHLAQINLHYICTKKKKIQKNKSFSFLLLYHWPTVCIPYSPVTVVLIDEKFQIYCRELWIANWNKNKSFWFCFLLGIVGWVTAFVHLRKWWIYTLERFWQW
jgi:hypothetical protein